MNRKSLFTAVLVLVLVLGGGVGAYVYFGKSNIQENINKFEADSKSGQDVLAEKFLPKEVSLVVSVNLQDPQSKDNFQHLLELFPESKDLSQEFWTGFLEGVNEEINTNSAPFSFEQDIYPVLKDSPRFVVGLGQKNANANTPDVYAAFSIADMQAFEALRQKVAARPNFQEDDYKGTKILKNDANRFFAVVQGDVCFITNHAENITQLLDRTDNNNSIYQDEKYRQVIGHLATPHIAYTYINLPLFLQQVITTDTNIGPEEQKVFNSDSFKLVQAVGFSLAAKQDGLALQGYAVGNEEVMKKLVYTFNTVPNSNQYLINKIPASNTFFYQELYNLKKTLSEGFRVNQLAYTELQQELAGGLDFASGIVQSMFGLDLQKDLLDLFDRGFALAIQFETGNLFPQITLLVDVKDHIDSAEKVVGLIDQGMNNLIGNIAQQSGSKTFLTKAKVSIGGKDLWRLKLNLDELVEKEPGIPPTAKEALQKMTAEFVYGLDANNVLVLSTIGHLEQKYNQANSVKSEASAQEGFGRIPVKNQGVSYINVAQALAYIDEWVQYIDKLEPLSQSDRASYDKVVNFIRPLKYLIFSSTANEYDGTAVGFVKITAGGN